MDNEIQIITIEELYFKPKFDFFNLKILDKTFTGIKRDPNIYVFKSKDSIKTGSIIQFEWDGLRYELVNVYEHFTSDKEWRIIECEKWKEGIIPTTEIQKIF
jgi:hypothetical protein